MEGPGIGVVQVEVVLVRGDQLFHAFEGAALKVGSSIDPARNAFRSRSFMVESSLRRFVSAIRWFLCRSAISVNAVTLESRDRNHTA